jgi:hypothetical protein
MVYPDCFITDYPLKKKNPAALVFNTAGEF